MRNPIFPAVLILSLAACRSNDTETRGTAEEAPRMASSVAAKDPRAAAQLVSGFHGLENSAWRWTQREFAVALAPPRGAAQRGAILALKLTVPPVVIEKLAAVTLIGSVDGGELAPETYRQPGNYTYRREVAADRLAGQSVKVDFRLDKALPPSEADHRELGVIVLSAALEPR